MKRLLLFVLLLALAVPAASAEIRLKANDIAEESRIAAAEYGALDAYFSPYDGRIYYLSKTDSGYEITVFGEDKEYRTVYALSGEDSYLSVRTDADGSIYLLKQASDETKKSGILRLTSDGDAYFETEFLFPAASCDLIPRRLEFSPDSACGCALLWLNNAGEYVSAMSVFRSFWGDLEGYDAFITITPGQLAASAVPMESLYDAYGYAAEGAMTLARRIAGGEVLIPTDVSISPSGERILATVPYLDQTLLYVIDADTLALELVYPPDGFSGEIGWTAEGGLIAVSDDGETVDIGFGGFNENAWNDVWEDSWKDITQWNAPEDQDWGGDSLGSWN